MHATDEPEEITAMRQRIAAYERQREAARFAKASADAAPLKEQIAALRPRLEAAGAWPSVTLIKFAPKRVHVHARETVVRFDTYESFSDRASYRFEMHDALNGTDDPGRWLDYLNGDSRGLNFFKTYSEDYKPHQTEVHHIHGEDLGGLVMFANRAIVCPMCGHMNYKCEDSEAEQKAKEKHFSLMDGTRSYRSHVYRYDVPTNIDAFESMLFVAASIIQQRLFASGVAFRRCENCRRQNVTFRTAWKRRFRDYERNPRDCDQDTANALIQQVSRIWPDEFGAKPQIKASIFRQAKKRARIQPLTRAERNFFAMHLAASQLKQLNLKN
jgi:predicted RNA-binding Zn-ribbon protein involved in translation (DUF1610 family)